MFSCVIKDSFKIILFRCICVFGMSAHKCSAHRGQMKATDPLALQVVVR